LHRHKPSLVLHRKSLAEPNLFFRDSPPPKLPSSDVWQSHHLFEFLMKYFPVKLGDSENPSANFGQ